MLNKIDWFFVTVNIAALFLMIIATIYHAF